MPWLDEIRFDDSGLVPVIAQEAATGTVLMVAHATREALQLTLESGYAHYWSRSRREIWRKGETSGHVQEVIEVRVDCDGDSLIYSVNQTGPACHTLNENCFYRVVVDDELVDRATTGGHILERVDAVIADRMASPVEGAYTNYLLAAGLDKILKKVGEEATEVVVAAKNDSAAELRSESADLLFHLLVLLRERGLELSEVWKELEERFGRAPRPRSATIQRSLEK